jgi:hypothetical protein
MIFIQKPMNDNHIKLFFNIYVKIFVKNRQKSKPKNILSNPLFGLFLIKTGYLSAYFRAHGFYG